MKIKLPFKKEKKEQEGPKKAFEEFAIDPQVIEELDNLPEEQLEEIVQVEENNVKTDEEVEIIEEPKKQVVDASSVEFINIVRDNIDFCAKEIKEVSETMDKIESQKNSESFWKKSENIRTISKYVNKVSEVQQKTLDLLVMFLGASGKMADDYDSILKTIDELGELNGGEAEVLNYLLKVKKMIKEIKNNDERLKAIIYDLEKQKEKTTKLEKIYNEKLEAFEKNSKIAHSKVNRLHARCNRQAFALLIAYIAIIALGIIIYIKLF